MYESSLSNAIVSAVAEQAGERPVARVRVEVGRLHHVEADTLAHCFADAAAGTVAASAALEVSRVPARGRCPGCTFEWESDDVPHSCPRCGSANPVVIGGSEVRLASIRYGRDA